MASVAVSSSEIARAYRHLYRGLLRAVQYSAPARHVARHKLRKAFRTDAPGSFNAPSVQNTVDFLTAAARERGIEHRIVRNIMLVTYWEINKKLTFYGDPPSAHIKSAGYIHYEMTIAMLNKDLGLCLR